jgi:dihydroceramidase
MSTSNIAIHCLLLIATVRTRSIQSEHHQSLDVKHFETKLDPTVGYWSPSTSSIDWCERNYVVTYYIAEFWNCLSSLTMCIVAGILFIRGLYNRLERRYIYLSLSFGIVGLGSAYFHGTLTHWGQMADELPMVYSMIIWWYILFHMNRSTMTRRSKYDWTIVLGVFYALFWTYIHNLQTFVIIFQGHFTLMVIGGIARLIYLYRQICYRTNEIYYLILFYTSLLLLASICWILDQYLCEQINIYFKFNPQLHAWWHVVCAIDSHMGIVIIETMRLRSLKTNGKVKFVFYCGFPFVDYSSFEQQILSRKTS